MHPKYSFSSVLIPSTKHLTSRCSRRAGFSFVFSIWYLVFFCSKKNVCARACVCNKEWDRGREGETEGERGEGEWVRVRFGLTVNLVKEMDTDYWKRVRNILPCLCFPSPWCPHSSSWFQSSCLPLSVYKAYLPQVSTIFHSHFSFSPLSPAPTHTCWTTWMTWQKWKA